MKEIITSPNAPVTGLTDASKPAAIAQAFRAGTLLFVSGRGPLNAILSHAGASFADVVNMRVCLRNVADFPKFNETFGEVMAGEKVTRTCIGGTPHRTGVNVEIDCIAVME